MKLSDIQKAKLSLELCSTTADGDSCVKCPYHNLQTTTLYDCMDKRYEDLVEILNWAEDAYKSIENFLHAKG